MKRFLFLILLLPTVLTAQWRMVSSSVSLNSTVDDSTYVIDVDFFSDLTGGGYLATGITADFLVFSQSGELYDITAATNLTLSSGRLTIVEVDNDYVDTEGAPTGQIIVYDPQGEYIPVTPFGNSNMGNVLQGAALAYNSKIKNQLAIATLDDTSSVISPYEGQLVYIKDAGNYQVRGAYTWSALDPGGGGSGDVTGPGSATNNAVARFDGTGGKTVQNSSVTIDDGGNVDIPGNITVTGDVDGRDIAADGTKLDGIEDNATADQTSAEIRDALDGLSGENRLDISAIKNDTVTRLIQDSIQVYFVDGVEVGRDTVRTAGSVAATNIRVYVDNYGAAGDGSTDDYAAIASAISAAGTGGEVYFSPNKTYLSEKQIDVSNRIITGGIGATLKRADADTSNLKAAVLDGATVLTVWSPGNFNVGDQIAVLDISDPNGGKGSAENSGTARVVSSISNDTIYLSGGISGAFDAGDIILQVFNQFSVSGTSTKATIRGLTFDGNRSNNDFTNSWTYNAAIYAANCSPVIEYCTFQNMPSETIFIGHDARVQHNYSNGSNGSFVHISTTGSSVSGDNYITKNILKNICEVPTSISGHNEGALTFSNYANYLYVEGNTLYTCGTAFIGPINGNSTESDDHVFIRGNQAYHTEGIIASNSNDDLIKNITVSDNFFKNCKALNLASGVGSIEDSLGVKNIEIANNELINSRISLGNASDAIIADNRIEIEPGVTMGSEAAILLRDCSNITISGNTIEDRNTTAAGTHTTGIAFEMGRGLLRLNSASLAATVWSYSRNIKISGNTILGYNYGITDDPSLGPASTTGIYQALEITGNTVVMRSTSNQYAMKVPPGAFCSGNTIYGTSTAAYGIRAVGTTSANSSTINGPIVTTNRVFGFGTGKSIEVGNSTQIYNAYVTGNFISSTGTNNSSGNSSFFNNIQVIAETPNIQLIRSNPSWY